MKIRNILFLLLAIALLGCSQHTEFRRKLDLAEVLMQENPDSAYRMLCAMNGHADSVSTSLRMRHLLLRSNAQNKAAVPFTSDSIGTLLAEYYDRKGTSNERMLAHYLQGCAHRDMGDWPSAVRCFNDAVAAADTAAADCNFDQLSIIYGQIGYLYDNLYLIEEALQAYNNAELYSPDTLCLLNFRDHKAGALEKKGEINHALKLMEEISEQYGSMGYPNLAARAKGVCIKLYARQGNFSKASAAINDYEVNSGYFLSNGDIQHGREVYYYTKGVYYEEIENVDSAEFYFRKLQRLGSTLNDQYLASLGLTRLYRAQQQADSVAKYAWQTFQYSDSLYDDNAAHSLRQTQAMYNYNRHQEVAFKNSIEAQEAQIWLRNLIIIGSLLFSIAIYLVMVYRRRLEAKMTDLKHKIQLQHVHNSAVVETLNKEVEEKTDLISQLHKQMNENAVDLQQNEQLRRTIQILEQQIQEHKKQIDAFRISKNATTLHNEPEVVAFIQKVKSNKEYPTPEEWQRITTLVETHHPSMKKIMNHNGISSLEIKICMLLKLDFTISDIVLTEKISNAILTNTRRRLMKKLFGAEGSAKEFDRRIREI